MIRLDKFIVILDSLASQRYPMASQVCPGLSRGVQGCPGGVQGCPGGVQGVSIPVRLCCCYEELLSETFGLLFYSCIIVIAPLLREHNKQSSADRCRRLEACRHRPTIETRDPSLLRSITAAPLGSAVVQGLPRLELLQLHATLAAMPRSIEIVGRTRDSLHLVDPNL